MLSGMKNMQMVSFPIVMSREGKWFVAHCPALDIATQGLTEEEVRENMKDLIKEYMDDPDTPKPDLRDIESAYVTISSVTVDVERAYHDKTPSVATA